MDKCFRTSMPSILPSVEYEEKHALGKMQVMILLRYVIDAQVIIDVEKPLNNIFVTDIINLRFNKIYM